MMGRALSGLAALALAGCASQLSYDLGKAEKPCHEQTFTGKAALVSCLTAQERPVWAQDEPQTLDLYDQYAEARDGLARERDAGTLAEKDYESRLADITSDFRSRIAERRQSATR
jgi:hypothetical protein